MLFFGNRHEDEVEKMEVVCTFITEEKIVNLSGLMLLTEILRTTQSSQGKAKVVEMKVLNVLAQLCR